VAVSWTLPCSLPGRNSSMLRDVDWLSPSLSLTFCLCEDALQRWSVDRRIDAVPSDMDDKNGWRGPIKERYGRTSWISMLHVVKARLDPCQRD
jgi:hypothetical protein